MKTILLLLGLLSLSSSSFAEVDLETYGVLQEYDYACRNVQVHIDRIERNKAIEGHVTGLPQEAHKLFKVVFYVKTNRWYIHPYENNSDQDGDGVSFAYLASDGTFAIKSVRREVPSRYLAAVLFPRKHRIVNSARRLHPLWGIFGGLTKHACNYTVIKGNGDFFL